MDKTNQETDAEQANRRTADQPNQGTDADQASIPATRTYQVRLQ